MASNVDGADHWGCAAGGMESMEAGRTATLAFGLSLWGAGDGGRWTLGRLSAIASGMVASSWSVPRWFTLRDVAGGTGAKGMGSMVAMLVGWGSFTLRSGLGSSDSWLGPCHGALTWLSHNGARGELGDGN